MCVCVGGGGGGGGEACDPYTEDHGYPEVT